MSLSLKCSAARSRSSEIQNLQRSEQMTVGKSCQSWLKANLQTNISASILLNELEVICSDVVHHPCSCHDRWAIPFKSDKKRGWWEIMGWSEESLSWWHQTSIWGVWSAQDEGVKTSENGVNGQFWSNSSFDHLSEGSNILEKNSCETEWKPLRGKNSTFPIHSLLSVSVIFWNGPLSALFSICPIQCSKDILYSSVHSVK